MVAKRLVVGVALLALLSERSQGRGLAPGTPSVKPMLNECFRGSAAADLRAALRVRVRKVGDQFVVQMRLTNFAKATVWVLKEPTYGTFDNLADESQVYLFVIDRSGRELPPQVMLGHDLPGPAGQAEDRPYVSLRAGQTRTFSVSLSSDYYRDGVYSMRACYLDAGGDHRRPAGWLKGPIESSAAIVRRHSSIASRGGGAKAKRQAPGDGAGKNKVLHFPPGTFQVPK